MNIETFREQFDGVRANRYIINPGAGNSGMTQLHAALYVKAVSVPGSSIGMIPVSFQGRQIKFSGERQFNDWTFTCYDSSDANVRVKLENWISLMDHVTTHTVQYNQAEDWTVSYNDMSGQGSGSTTTRGFKLHHCWPIDISPIDLSYDMVDSFAEFTVTLAYDYHTTI